MFNHMDLVNNIGEIRVGSLLVIQRKRDKRRILVKCKQVVNGNEIIMGRKKNDYFNFDMYLNGESWVNRVWQLPEDIEITSITNNINEFPR